MSDILEILRRGDNSLEALLRAVLLDSENKVPAERLRIVGALAEGNIIESGSNANGYYFKLTDGTLVAYMPRTSYVVNNETGTTCFTNVWAYYIDITFPISFIDIPAVVSDIGVNYYAQGWSHAHIVSRNTAQIVVFIPRSTLSPVNTVAGSWLAIGRWKA